MDLMILPTTNRTGQLISNRTTNPIFRFGWLTLTTVMSRNGHAVFRCKFRCCCCLFRFHYAIKRCEICERRDVTRDFYAIIRCRRKYENILFSTATSLNRIKIRGNIVHFTDVTSLNRIMKSK